MPKDYLPEYIKGTERRIADLLFDSLEQPCDVRVQSIEVQSVWNDEGELMTRTVTVKVHDHE